MRSIVYLQAAGYTLARDEIHGVTVMICQACGFGVALNVRKALKILTFFQNFKNCVAVIKNKLYKSW